MSVNNIKRWWQRKGFGIESKTDYAFLHDIILEKLPYYAYSDLQHLFPNATRKEHKTAQLLLRISNYLQPSSVKIHGNDPQLAAAAVSFGCKRAMVETAQTPYVRLEYAGISSKVDAGLLIEFHQNKRQEDVPYAIILTHIGSHNVALWRQVLAANAVTYDLRHLGIALMRKGRYPEHYMI